MIPLPTSDDFLVKEHAFYATGNLKHVLPFIKFQSYDLVHKSYNHLYKHETKVSMVLILGIIFGLAWCVRFILSRTRNETKSIADSV